MRTAFPWLYSMLFVAIGMLSGCHCGCTPEVGEEVLIIADDGGRYTLDKAFYAKVVALSDSTMHIRRDDDGRFFLWPLHYKSRGGYEHNTWEHVKTEKVVRVAPHQGGGGEQEVRPSVPLHVTNTAPQPPSPPYDWASHWRALVMGAYGLGVLLAAGGIYYYRKEKRAGV